MSLQEEAPLHLGDETWGERLGRAHRRSGLSLREVARRLESIGIETTDATLNRLHREPELPHAWSRRQLAVAYVLVLGYDPEDFGLSNEALTRTISVEEIRAALDGSGDVGSLRSRWFANGADEDARHLAELLDSRQPAVA